jgi:ABC-type multidrug transport system permease subunit
MFFASLGLSVGTMLMERREGMIERLFISGITSSEILLSHFIVLSQIMLAQTVFISCLSFYGFQLTLLGSFTLVFCLLLISGLCGLWYGFFISLICDNDRTATYLSMGSMTPMFFLCGLLWPLEGMYPALKAVAVYLPLTKSIESMRAILQKGWTIQSPDVYWGFISTSIWIGIYLVVSFIVLKYKKS